jgi:hypothetical protein
MGYIKKRIAALSKEFGGKIKASAAAMDWFQKGIKSKNVTEAQLTRSRFEPGKIYVFKYSPKYEKELPWFDENPVVLAIEQAGENDFGVNLNLLPVPFKEKFLDELFTKMNIKVEKKKESDIASDLFGIEKPSGINALTEKPLKITYQGMKNYLEKFGYDFALRQYIPARRKDQAVVSYSKWPEIAICDFMEFNGTNVMKVRRMFNDYLKKNI